MTDEYKVGYRKPPKATRFQKGQSGNKSGRPKRRMSLEDLFRKELKKMISVQENGEQVRITMLELLVKQAVKRAAQGRDQSILTWVLGQHKADADDPDGFSISTDDELELKEALRKRGLIPGASGE